MTSTEPDDLPWPLIERALDGDRDAFRGFYDHYDPRVRWAVGLRVYRWPQLVPHFDDVVQDVWWGLVQRKGKRLRYHDGRVPFSRFLTLVATRLAWRIAKRRLDHPEIEPVDVEEEDEDDDLVARLVQVDFLERLADSVQRRLDPSARALFEGYYVHGERLKDVGARLGMNENATYKRHERLLEKLQQLAEELLEERKGTAPPPLVAVVLAAWMLGLPADAPGERGTIGVPGTPGSEVDHG